MGSESIDWDKLYAFELSNGYFLIGKVSPGIEEVIKKQKSVLRDLSIVLGDALRVNAKVVEDSLTSDFLSRIREEYETGLGLEKVIQQQIRLNMAQVITVYSLKENKCPLDGSE